MWEICYVISGRLGSSEVPSKFIPFNPLLPFPKTCVSTSMWTGVWLFVYNVLVIWCMGQLLAKFVFSMQLKEPIQV